MVSVSVGVPVFNGANYLRVALDSLLSQTFSDLEVIIADNASTDETDQIGRAAAASDSRVTYHRHADNIGAAANFNFTLERASGEFFMWSPHDDVRHPQFVEKAVEAFTSYPGAAAVFSRSVSIDSSGNQRRGMQRPDNLLSADPAARFRAAINCRHPGVIIFGLIRSDLMRRVDGQRNYPGGDRVLAAELALNGPFVELDEVMFFNRDHPDRYVQLKNKLGDEGRREQEGWWVPARAQSVTFPGWRRLDGYVRAIRRAPLNPTDRRRCYLALLGAATDQEGAMLRAMAKDILIAGRTAGRMAIGRR
ncbi:MAG TPA: glycosyltransferase family 2 protein [Acidimicrobiia bacterium]|nr:glycosyltransferase family 2 protein [Acidimicrobiia bacterium]